MPGKAKIDYKEAERRFVVEGTSIRQICTDMGLKSNASMSNIARRDDWLGKRAAYKSAIARRSYEVSAAGVALEGKAIKDETILAGRATIRAYLQGLTDGSIKPNSRDAQVWAAWLLHEAAGPAEINTEGPDVRNVTPPDLAELRRVVEAARGRVAPAGGMGAVALVEPENTRPN